MIAASIILYLIGCVLCYFLCRKNMWLRNDKDAWTAMDRLVTFNISLLSWVSIIIFLVGYVLFENDAFDPDKEVKW